MFFVLAWVQGYDKMVSVVNALTCVLMRLVGIPTYLIHVNLVAYFLLDMLFDNKIRPSDIYHHLLSMLTIGYVYSLGETKVEAMTQAIIAMECGNIVLNLYHDSYAKQPELPSISGLLSTHSWSLCFFASFILTRFVTFIYYVWPHLDCLSLHVIFYCWLALNVYWTAYMVRRFVVNPKKADKSRSRGRSDSPNIVSVADASLSIH